MDLNGMLWRAVELGASDVHLKHGQPPMLRRDGIIAPLEGWPSLDSVDLDSVLLTVAASSPAKLAAFRDHGDLDIAYASESLPRFRVNAYRQRGEISFAFRAIPNKVPSLSELGMPPGVEKLAAWQRGLILVTGATGAGKSTTLAAMVDHINRTRHQHIVTIEDPIEILHEDHGCIVNQREVELDTRSFEFGPRQALRQDPDVILIGELRDAETAETALQAAESGHLVLSTMHTVDAPEAVARTVEFFSEEKQPQIRSILAANLRGVISQRLLPRIGGGRVAAVEVMVSNNRIADLTRENKLEEIPVAIAEGSFFEMQTFTQALIELVLSGRVDREIAAGAATNRHDFLLSLEYALKSQAAGPDASEMDGVDPTPTLRAVRPAPAA
jgi:twitching motility protein PilT